jgi:hypothetical protein
MLTMLVCARAFGLVALAVALDGAAQPLQPWPAVETPPSARVQVVAADMLLNGKPSRIVRFHSDAAEPTVASFYRQLFRARHTVENRIRGHLVIATRQGDFFHTVQLRAGDSHTVEGTVITTRLQPGGTRTAATLQTERWMPADTAFVSTLQFTDGGRRSLLVVGINQASVHANRDHIVATLQAKGFGLSKEGHEMAIDAEHSSLTFASPTEEATVTISNAGPYRAVLIHRSVETR